MIYSKRDVAVMAYAFGLLTGVIVAFAACSPDDRHSVTVVEAR